MKEKNSIIDIIIYIFFIIFGLSILIPFWTILITSLSTRDGFYASTFHFWSKEFSLNEYKNALSNTGGILNGLWVSIRVTVLGTSMAMLLTTMSGYVLSKKDMPGRNLLFNIVLFTMFFSGGLMPFYITVRNLGIFDTLFAMFLPTAISTFYTILMKNYFESIPPSLEEVARVEGCNDIQILFKIVIPLSTPAIAAIGLFYGINFWNEYFYSTLFVSNNNLYPLPVILRQMIVQNLAIAQLGQLSVDSNEEQFKMACIIISIIPVICVYPFIQKYFTKGLMMGGVKG